MNVDNLLVISHEPNTIMVKIGKQFEIKNKEYGLPKQYLRANVQLFPLSNGSMAWSLLSASYVLGAVDTVRCLLAENGCKLKSIKRPHNAPLCFGYKPELNVTDQCDAEMTSRYQ